MNKPWISCFPVLYCAQPCSILFLSILEGRFVDCNLIYHRTLGIEMFTSGGENCVTSELADSLLENSLPLTFCLRLIHFTYLHEIHVAFGYWDVYTSKWGKNVFDPRWPTCYKVLAPRPIYISSWMAWPHFWCTHYTD